MQANHSPRGNVMTSLELESYQKRKDQENAAKRSDGSQSDDDDINYDSGEDDDASKKQVDQRKRQEAHIAGYRQQMMRTTNGPASPAPIQHTRVPTLQGPWMDIPDYDDDDDDDIPLAVLQAQRRKESMYRLAGVRSNPNLRASSQQQLSRPGSAQGNNNSRLQLPSFARSLPQDPFQDPYQDPFKDPFSLTSSGSFQQRGLVAVIASEERAKATRRGSPSATYQPVPSPSNNPFGLTMGPSHTGQMASPYGMPQMSRPQTASSGYQGQFPQMSFGLQAQSQYLQAAAMASQPKTSHSWNPFSSQAPVDNRGMAAARPRVLPTYGNGMGYAPSIPPAERSNIGLPSRYRPVLRARN
ncbi:hypothetical protein FZEAL_68 [Fusarium zealandicum]|uniref:Uncharacterized protein n=1 Tax=Fusarium zealandicum TaxID=1053134 RepID=A0A8H4UW40_9HYPO|nr:hypothetical protein FZEAL_68 [Fusarium zealandicum]